MHHTIKQLIDSLIHKKSYAEVKSNAVEQKEVNLFPENVNDREISIHIIRTNPFFQFVSMENSVVRIDEAGDKVSILFENDSLLQFSKADISKAETTETETSINLYSGLAIILMYDG